MACLDGKVKVKITIVLNHKLSFFDFVHKNISEIYLTLFVLLDGVHSTTQKGRMRQNIADPLDVYEDRSVSPHHITVYVIVEGLEPFGSKITSTLTSPWEGITPDTGYTVSEFAYSISPLIDCLSKLKVKGTSSMFFIQTISLFLPPINRGPKFIFPISKNTLGSLTLPAMRKY